MDDSEWKLGKLTLVCQFAGELSKFNFYTGIPKQGNNPIANQANWLSKDRGGVVPTSTLKHIEDINSKAMKRNIPFNELMQYFVKTKNL